MKRIIWYYRASIARRSKMLQTPNQKVAANAIAMSLYNQSLDRADPCSKNNNDILESNAQQAKTTVVYCTAVTVNLPIVDK